MTFHYQSKASYGLANFTENIRCLNLQYRSGKKETVHAVGTKSTQRVYDCSSSYWAVQNMCVNIKGNLNLNTYIKSCVRKNRNLQLTIILCHVTNVSRGSWEISDFRDSNVQFLYVLVQLAVLHLTTGF
jgi:hypothetical protein